MQVIDYYSCGRREHWLEEIGKSNWRAGRYLHQLLSGNRFKDSAGEKSAVLMLVDGDSLISFCTYAETDDIRPTALTPWIGFVYTFPQYRGRRCFGRLLQEAEKLARAEEARHVYISTTHTGLYEKYGFDFYRIMNDVHGEPSRVYRKRVN